MNFQPSNKPDRKIDAERKAGQLGDLEKEMEVQANESMKEQYR